MAPSISSQRRLIDTVSVEIGAGMRMVVLVVEDNPAMRRVIGAVIADPGGAVEIVECSDGASAVAAYERCRPDWVLMDIHLGGMTGGMTGGITGIQASSMIRRADPAARIAIVTNYDDKELREAAAAAGACAYVLKENLLELRAILGRRAASDSKGPS